MINLKSNEQRAKIAIIFLWIILVLELITLASNIMQFFCLKNYQEGITSINELESNDLRVQVIAYTYIIVYVGCATIFIMWFRRAYNNLHLKGIHLNYDESWASGSWFVPIMNFIRPYQIMKELYFETKNKLNLSVNVNENQLNTTFVGIWWTLWVIISILGQIEYRMPSETIDHFVNSTLVGIIGNFLGIPTAYFAIKVIKDYSEVEPLLLNENEDIINQIGKF